MTTINEQPPAVTSFQVGDKVRYEHRPPGIGTVVSVRSLNVGVRWPDLPTEVQLYYRPHELRHAAADAPAPAAEQATEKPAACPWCGSDEVLFKCSRSGAWWWSCCIGESRVWNSRAEAVAAWNRRVPPPSRGVVEAAVAELHGVDNERRAALERIDERGRFVRFLGYKVGFTWKGPADDEALVEHIQKMLNADPLAESVCRMRSAQCEAWVAGSSNITRATKLVDERLAAYRAAYRATVATERSLKDIRAEAAEDRRELADISASLHGEIGPYSLNDKAEFFWEIVRDGAVAIPLSKIGGDDDGEKDNRAEAQAVVDELNRVAGVQPTPGLEGRLVAAVAYLYFDQDKGPFSSDYRRGHRDARDGAVAAIRSVLAAERGAAGKPRADSLGGVPAGEAADVERFDEGFSGGTR